MKANYISYKKHQKLYRKISKALRSGHFATYSMCKKRSLLDQLERYESRLARKGITVAGVATLMFGTPILQAQVPQTSGSEFRVNTFIPNAQSNSSVGMDSNGNFVVVWGSEGQSGNGDEIYGQRYNSDGTPNGGEFQINTFTTTGDQKDPSVAMDSDGDFVVVWESENDGQIEISNEVYGQRYNSDGTPNGGEFQVNTFTTRDQNDPVVAMDSDGNFVVVWESYGQIGNYNEVYAQRYNSNGTPNGGEFRVNTFTTGDQDDPSVAMNSDGDFIVVWESAGQDGSNNGVYAQGYNNAGAPIGGEFRINTFTTGNQDDPSVAVDNNGDFVVVWESAGQDGSDDGIYGQRYNSNGAALGGEFQVNTYTTDNQTDPSVATDQDGSFVVVWESDGQDGSDSGIYGQRYNNDGTLNGEEFQVNTYTNDGQINPSIATDGNGDFIVTWDSYEQDGSDYGVYAQRYSSESCKGDLVLPNEVIEQDTIYADWASIESRQMLQNGSSTIEVRYEAATQISLKEGFHAKHGVLFEAAIEDCALGSSSQIAPSEEEEQIIARSVNTDKLPVTVFPNPVDQVLHVQIPSGRVVLSIINLQAKVMWQQSNDLLGSTQPIDVSQLIAGTYFIRVQSAAGVETIKFVKL
ncbi:MAG: T9SS type A sorting domain-containing protein [Bacteroidota bacterium]